MLTTYVCTKCGRRQRASEEYLYQMSTRLEPCSCGRGSWTFAASISEEREGAHA
jgi:hypothetical protein